MVTTFTGAVWGDRARRRKLLAGVTLLGLATAAIGGGTAAVRSQDGGPVQHCVVRIEPLEPGNSSSRVSQPTCFDTFKDAFRSIGVDPREFDTNQ